MKARKLLPLLFSCLLLFPATAQANPPRGAAISADKLLSIMWCMEEIHEPIDWLSGFMIAGGTGCMREYEDRSEYWERLQPLEDLSRLNFYQSKAGVEQSAVPGGGELYRYDPAMVDWIEYYLKFVLANDKLRERAQRLYWKNRGLFRAFVFAREHMQRTHEYGRVMEEFKKLEPEEWWQWPGYEYAQAISEGYRRYWDRSFPNRTEMSEDIVLLCTGFWLRRGFDGTEEQLWNMLERVMLAFDAEWFDTKGMKDLGGAGVIVSEDPEELDWIDYNGLYDDVYGSDADYEYGD